MVIGKAATVYFVEGVSLKEARRTYLSNRKRRPGRLTAPGADNQREKITALDRTRMEQI